MAFYSVMARSGMASHDGTNGQRAMAQCPTQNAAS
jgi:hypothetical protein